MPKQFITAQDLTKIKIVSDPQISPDGRHVIYTVKVADTAKNKYWQHLWMADTSDRSTRQFTSGEVSDSSPRWSADGKTIAFLRSKDKQTQVWLVPADGGEARPLTKLPEGDIGELTWAPGHTHVAFTFRITPREWTRAAAKEREEKGHSTPVRVVTRARYRLDGAGFQDERQHIWVCDVASGATTQLTRGHFDEYSPAWSPDGKNIAFLSNRSADPDRWLYRVDVWTVPASGGAPKKVPTPVGDKLAVAWSPDGKWLAYIGSDGTVDPWKQKNERLWIVSPRGARSQVRCLTMEVDRTVGNVTLGDSREPVGSVPLWSPDSRTIYIPISDSGSVHLYGVELTGQMTQLTRGAIDISGISLDGSGARMALLVADPTHPAEVFLGRVRGKKMEMTPLSDANGEWLKRVQVSQPEEFWIAQQDGTRVQGWIMRPPNFAKNKKYPLLLYVHGGPHAQYGNVFFHELQYHAARGYVVAYSNPRGSNGRDEQFGAAIHWDWGNLDYQDVMAVADYAEALPYVDKTRTAIAGGSYGGYMTNWVVGHTQRFKVAVTDRCVSTFVGMAGTTDVPQPPGSYWPGNPWGEDFQKGWDQSPLKYVENVRTPMLVIHSEGDLRCPIGQSEQWFTALKWLGRKAVFVRYPRETSHGLSRNGPIDMRLDRLARIARWIDKYINPGAPTRQERSGSRRLKPRTRQA